MKLKSGENFLSLQCKVRGGGGFLSVKIAILNEIPMTMHIVNAIIPLAMLPRCVKQFSHTVLVCVGRG